MDRHQFSSAVPAEIAERDSDRPYRPAPDPDEAYARYAQRQIDDALTPGQVDAAFDRILRGYVEPTPTEYERLERLLAQHRGHAMVWGMMPARSREDARWIKAKLEPHRVACKALRKRIERLAKRGVI